MSKRVKIAGVSFNSLSYDGVLATMSDVIGNGNKLHITTPNPEMILNSVEDEKFHQVLESAGIAIPDGVGVLWAASYLKKPKKKTKVGRFLQLYLSLSGIIFWPKSVRNVLPYRVTGSDLFERVVYKSQDEGWKIFLLGAQSGIAKKAIGELKKKYPKASFVGSYAGTPSLDEEEGICELINDAKPDILFVAFGSPAQEFWIHRNLFKLSSVKVAIGVGGAFDFASQSIKRAPKWMRKIGLEWLWRLFRQPKRHKRIKNATFDFIRLIKKEKYSNVIY